jgi:para-nitrobenzyl esterase
MMTRRELLKSSLLTGGAAITGSALHVRLSRAVLATGTASAEPIVETKLGKLRGAFANGAYCFKGIPYGASTEGSQRFLPSSPPKPWPGVRDALQLGPSTPQDKSWDEMNPDITKLFGDFAPGTMGEDCLVLTLWTASLHSSAKRPVMVWLHGGGYDFGSAGMPVYDGTNLAAKHDVVVVGINHRLNVFGHLYLGQIGGAKYADSGNVGMLDIVLALQWVRDNIGQFGGDPNNVTIFGESGGGWKVSVLMALHPAEGLFHKAIVESGSQLRAFSPEEADRATRKLLTQAHVAPDRVEDLLNIPMNQLVAILHSMNRGDAINLGPVLDGRSLRRHPFDPDAPGATAKVPMLIGTTADENTVLYGLQDPKRFSLDEAGMRSELKNYLGLADESKLDELTAAYKRSRPRATPSDIYFAVATDREFRVSAIKQAELKAAQRAAPAYMYLFSWPLPVLGGRFRAGHFAEVPFVFDNLEKAVPLVGPTSESVQRLADIVSGTWTAFARTGNPNHADLPHWPVYDAGTRATMIFDNQCHVVNDPGKEERLAIASVPLG